MSQNRKLSASAEFDPATVAALAARLLPPMVLPEGWEKMDQTVLQAALSAGKRDSVPADGEWFGLSFFRPECPFDFVAAEAVRRAHLLLDHASGRAEAEIEERKRISEGRKARLSAEDPAAQEAAAAFIAKHGNSPPDLMKAGAFAIGTEGDFRESTLLKTLREWKREKKTQAWMAHRLEAVPVIFADESAPQGRTRKVDLRNPHGLDEKGNGYVGFIDPDAPTPDGPDCYTEEVFDPRTLIVGGLGSVILDIRRFFQANRNQILSSGMSVGGSEGGKISGRKRTEKAKKNAAAKKNQKR